MARHADLVELALRRHASGLDVRRHDLAPDPAQLSRWPAFLRGRVHHLMVDRNSRRLATRAPDGIFHVLDGSHAYLARHFPSSRVVVTCHDLIPSRMAAGELGRRPNLAARWLIGRSVRRLASAALVLPVSRHAARDAGQRAGVEATRLAVVPNPVDEAWLAELPRPRAPRPPPDAYVFHLGHDGAYKNRAAVWRIFSRIAPVWPGRLVIAGAPCSAGLSAEIRSAGLSDRVEFVPTPDDARLRALYRGASLLLFPSLMEGFGWPPLEALACGCPVVASDVGGLRDVLGDELPCLFNPADEDGMAAAALDLLRNPGRADAWVAAGRSRVAACTLERYARGLRAAYARVDERFAV